MAKFQMRYRQNWSIGRVVTKIVITLLSLYVGGTIVTEIGKVMNSTTSPFYKGLTLIGWTVSTSGQITDTTGSGILSVIGIVGIASVVMEFVEIRMK